MHARSPLLWKGAHACAAHVWPLAMHMHAWIPPEPASAVPTHCPPSQTPQERAWGRWSFLFAARGGPLGFGLAVLGAIVFVRRRESLGWLWDRAGFGVPWSCRASGQLHCAGDCVLPG